MNPNYTDTYPECTQKDGGALRHQLDQEQAHALAALNGQKGAASARELTLQRALADEKDLRAAAEEWGRGQKEAAAQQIALGRHALLPLSVYATLWPGRALIAGAMQSMPQTRR